MNTLELKRFLLDKISDINEDHILMELKNVILKRFPEIDRASKKKKLGF